MGFPWDSHGIPMLLYDFLSQDLVAELPWILGQEEEQVVVMLGIPATKVSGGFVMVNNG